MEISPAPATKVSGEVPIDISSSGVSSSSSTSSTVFLDGEDSDEVPIERSSSGVSSSSSSSSAVVFDGKGPDEVTIEEDDSGTNNFDLQSTSKSSYDDDDEGDVCRICRNSGDADNPLRYPCACSGSIKFVHQDCLLQWLNHSNSRHCEVCKHAFSFSPVYADDAPARLPFQEFVCGVRKKTCHVLKFFLRLGFVLSVWFLIIPFITFWIWRGVFVRSLNEAKLLFISHMSPTMIVTDCLHGVLLSASIVLFFLGATSLRDYLRHLRELGGLDAEREEGNEINGAHAIRRPAVQPGEGDVDDIGEAEGVGGAGQLIRRDAEIGALQWERQADHVEQMFDGLDDADGAEDVPFDELVGMQGPIFHLVENAFTVLASNFIFLVVVMFLPFSLGRLIIHYMSWFFFSAATPVLSTFMPLTESAFSLANIMFKNSLMAVANLSSENPDSTLIDHMTEMLKVNTSGLSGSPNNISNSSSVINAGTDGVSDITTLAVGYVFIFFLVFLYFGTVALVRYINGESVTMGRFQGIASMADAIPSLLPQFVASMKHLMVIVKVVFLLMIELGVFPLMCGWWLDICTIRMFGKSLAQRVEFFSVSPFSGSLVHWAVGICYMLQISVFVSLLRGVLRTGVFYFLRDPADPNYNPFRDLFDDPVLKHARRVLLSVAVYGSLIVLLVFFPVKLALRMVPSIFPLDIIVSDLFTEIPADILLFQICIPFAVEHCKLKTTIKSVLRCWFTAFGWVLGLTDFLLPGPEDGQDEANGEDGRQERLRGLHLGGGAQGNQAGIFFPPNSSNEVDGSGSHNVNEEYDGEEQSDLERYSFVFRIALLLVVAWMTLLIFNAALIIVPVSLGRAIFNVIPRLPLTHGIKCNDLYAFTIGSYVIWSAIAAVRYTIEQIRSRRVAILLGQIWKWGGIVFKSSGLLSIWFFVIPILIGLLVELLVIMPMRVPIDESPVFLLYQDWAVGLVFLKIWTKLVMFDHLMPLVNETWRVKFARVKEDGFSRLQGLWVLREIVSPIILKLLTALCVPYVLARGVFPVFGYPLIVNSAVYRFAWLGCLTISCLYFYTKRFYAWLTNLHNSIRDDRYLTGHLLHNYGEIPAEITGYESRTMNLQGNVAAGPEVDFGLRFRR